MKQMSRILLGAVLMMPVFTSGCAGHRQVYVWGPGETVYYGQWERDTHRDHVDWERRNEADQRAYRAWRRHHH